MLIALCSDKGSPGTTTTALALASAWSAPAAVVEADPYGGDLPLRVRTQGREVLPETPTGLTLAAAARSTTGTELLERFTHRINDQLAVVPAPLMAEQTAGVADWESLATRLTDADTPLFVDVGRLHASSPVLALAAAADVVLPVARAETESMIRLRERAGCLVPALASHREAPPRLFPVIVGLERHRDGDLRDLRMLLEDTSAGPLVAGVGHIAYDLTGVGHLLAGQPPTGRLARSKLMRSARRTVGELAAALFASRQSEAVT